MRLWHRGWGFEMLCRGSTEIGMMAVMASRKWGGLSTWVVSMWDD
jgi:hypothetical protein